MTAQGKAQFAGIIGLHLNLGRSIYERQDRIVDECK